MMVIYSVNVKNLMCKKITFYSYWGFVSEFCSKHCLTCYFGEINVKK